mgnify:CR=1 FL=1
MTDYTGVLPLLVRSYHQRGARVHLARFVGDASDRRDGYYLTLCARQMRWLGTGERPHVDGAGVCECCRRRLDGLLRAFGQHERPEPLDVARRSIP